MPPTPHVVLEPCRIAAMPSDPNALVAFGEWSGKPDMAYVHPDAAEMAGALQEAGRSDGFAGSYVEMTSAFNAGTVCPLDGRTAANTTTTPIEAFADDFARAYAAA